MKSNLTTHLTVVLGLVVCLGAGLPGIAQGQNPPAKLTINDSFMPGSQLLFSDGNSVNHPELGPMYVDWRLASGDPCVFGWVKTADGFFFMYLYRGSNAGADCHDLIPPEQQRTFHLKFPATSGICTQLGLGIDTTTGTCELTGHTKPRVRAEKLFGKRAKETTVAFMFYLGADSYSLDTAGDISGAGDTRTLTNATRAAALRKLGTTPGGTPVGSPFVFPFDLTVTRVVQ